MSSSKTINTLNGVVAVNLLFSVWTGRKTLADGDLSLNGETPPKEIISLGSKHTTDPKALKIFSTLKRRAERLCQSVGISFMGGYAIPTAQADYINSKLHEIVEQFNIEKAAYLAKHESIQAEWIFKYPAYEEVLTRALTPVSVVEGRINATFSMYRVQSIESEVSQSTGLEPQVNQMSSTLDNDILKESSRLLSSLNKALKPCQTNVNGLRKLREKVEGLAFLNSKYSALNAEIVKVEQQLTAVGNLNFDDQNKLSGLLYRMASPERLNELMTQANSPSQSKTKIPPVITEGFGIEEDDFNISAPVVANSETASVYF